MAYYAYNGGVTTDTDVGEVEITLAQYRMAIEGMGEGLIVVVRDGKPSLETKPEPASEPEPEPEYVPTELELRQREIDATPKVDDMIKRLRSASAEQIEDWINANMTNLAQARVVVATILKIMATRV